MTYNSWRNFRSFDFRSANSTAVWFWSPTVVVDAFVALELDVDLASAVSIGDAILAIQFEWYLSRSRAMRTMWSCRCSMVMFCMASLFSTSVCESVTRRINSTMACCVSTSNSLIRPMNISLFGHWTAAPSSSVNNNFNCSNPARVSDENYSFDINFNRFAFVWILTWWMSKYKTIGNDEQRLTQFIFIQCLQIAYNAIEIFSAGTWQCGCIDIVQRCRMVLWFRVDLPPNNVKNGGVQQRLITG